MKFTERRSMRVIPVLLLIAGVAMFESCEKYTFKMETIIPGDSVRFHNDIQPVFTDNCILCHKGTRDPDLRAGNSYNSLSSGGYINSPLSSSKLYNKINANHPSSLSESDRAKILTWILQGAKNN